MRASLEWAVAALSCLVAMMAVASEETAGVCTATGSNTKKPFVKLKFVCLRKQFFGSAGT
eukprot:5058628-Amphidinium_carterae.1